MATDTPTTPFERVRPTLRPTVRGTQAMVASGHHLATLAALRLLERGGNAVDAGVAAGICLGVLQSDLVSFGGVAPIIVHMAGQRGPQTVPQSVPQTVAGLGRWPRLASVALFQERCGGEIPAGVLRTVVPAAPDAWITALRRFGTMTFEDVTRDAIALARDGFPMHPFMAGNIRADEAAYRQWPANAEVYLPGGRPPEVGQVFRQPALADTLERMVRAERARRFSGRDAALQAARDCFYTGELAEAMLDFHLAHDGLLRREDLAAYRSPVEEAPQVAYRGLQVYGCGPWCQGPALLQALALLETYDLPALGHNSPAYIHTLSEAFKLVFADREAFIGDPDFVRVPLGGLLSKAYAAERRTQIDPARAWAELPPPGDPWRFEAEAAAPAADARGTGSPGGPGSAGSAGDTARLSAAPGDTADRWDTSHVAVIDRWGNLFSATPSDTPTHSPLVPQLGIICSSRGTQSWVDERHASSVAPGKRPRLTPAPALVLRDGRPVLAFGTPGGDVQIQAMAQVLVNLVDFRMDPQEAVEAPRFATYNFPGSFSPHAYNPGLLRMERRLGDDALAELARLGNRVEPWEDFAWRSGGVCAVLYDAERGIVQGAADPRRECYAFGY
jgi:gamma-glutamyltranspeptidase/glutathione hydrolase